MINTIYKPRGSRIWRWKFRLRPQDGKIQDVSLGTSDKQMAETFRGERLREKEHESAGFIPAKATRDAALRNLENPLPDFRGDMRRRGKSEKYLANLEFRVGRLIADCGWNTAQDVSADSFQAWPRGQNEGGQGGRLGGSDFLIARAGGGLHCANQKGRVGVASKFILEPG